MLSVRQPLHQDSVWGRPVEAERRRSVGPLVRKADFKSMLCLFTEEQINIFHVCVERGMGLPFLVPDEPPWSR